MIQEIDLENHGNELINHIDKFVDTRILVIGDIILDEYLWGDVSRISPEAPVPVVEIKRETKSLGGAANVIHNIHSLGGQALICGVVGNDSRGNEISERIMSLGISSGGIIVDSHRQTSVKTRVVAQNQQVVRYDRENRHEINNESIEKLIGYIKENINSIDGVIVADYGKGVISSKLMKKLRKLITGFDTVLAVDPKTDNFEYYQEIDIITPNHHEASTFCRFEIIDEKSLLRAGEFMLQKLRCRSVLITQGKDGMTLFENDREPCHIPTIARKVFDVSGAGDTVISTLCLGMASGLDIRSAAIISNYAAGIVVGEVGTSTVTAEELKKVLITG